ncbi:MAG: hypothetical protein ACTJLK_04700 [Anaplasma sp.]
MSGVGGSIAGVSRLGRERLLAKLCAAVLVLSAAAFLFCAAYVFASGASLLDSSPAGVGFFVSMALAFASIIGVIVFCGRLRVMDRYGLIVSVSDGRFESAGMLKITGPFVQSGVARAEVTASTLGKSGRGRAAFDATSCCVVVALGIAVCAFSSAFGVIVASTHGDFVRAAQAMFEVSAASPVPLVCLISAGAALLILVVGFAGRMLSSSPGVLVISDGKSRFSDADIRDITGKLNVSASDVTDVRISRVPNVIAMIESDGAPPAQ